MILTHSPKTIEINRALLVARQACGKVRPKEEVNPHFKSKFMPLAEVLRITEAPLIEAGVLMLQAQGRDSKRPEYVAVETRLIHASSGEYYKATMSMLPKNEGCQEALSCATYMKRSCLASLMGLSLWGEDDDAEAATDSTPVRTDRKSGEDDDAEAATDSTPVRTDPFRTTPPGYQEFVAGILDAETDAEAYDVYLKTQTRDLTNWLKHDETMLGLATILKDEGNLRRATLIDPDTGLPPVAKKAPAKKGKKRASKNS